MICMRSEWTRLSGWRSTRGSCRGSSLLGNNGFGFANRPLVQVPGVDRFSTAFAREAGAELFLGLVEGFFCVHPGAVGFVIGFLELFRDEHCLRIANRQRRPLLPMRRRGSRCLCCKRLIRCLYTIRPSLSRCPAHLIESGI